MAKAEDKVTAKVAAKTKSPTSQATRTHLGVAAVGIGTRKTVHTAATTLGTIRHLTMFIATMTPTRQPSSSTRMVEGDLVMSTTITILIRITNTVFPTTLLAGIPWVRYAADGFTTLLLAFLLFYASLGFAGRRKQHDTKGAEEDSSKAN